MAGKLALDLADIQVEHIEIPADENATSLESLMNGHGATEVGASVLPVGCCSCCVPCCCCWG